MGFTVFIFAVFTFRAGLNPDGAVLVSDKRILATALGGLVYWLAIREISRHSYKPIGAIVFSTLYIGLMGVAALLAVRSAIDAITLPDLSESFARNIRWILLWIGYFGAWVAGFMTLLFYRRLQLNMNGAPTGTAESASVRPTAAAATRVERIEPPLASDTLEWLVEAVAAEISRDPQVDRTTLIARLLQQSGYETTDADFDPESAQLLERRRLVSKIGARIAS